MKAVRITSILSPIFLVLILMSDLHYKYISINGIQTFKFTVISKVIIALAFLVISVINFKKIKKGYFMVIAGLIMVIILGYANTDSNRIFYSSYTQAQYLFGLFVFYFFFSFYKFLDVALLLKTLTFIIILNFLFILIGLLYEIELFKTYLSRFGFNGIFKGTSEASYFYLFSILLFANLPFSKKNVFVFGLVIMSSLLVGSKSLYVYLFFIALLTAFNLFKKQVGFLKAKHYFLLILLAVAFVYSFLWLVLTQNTTLNNVFIKDGLLSAIFSYRDVLTANAIYTIGEKYNFFNYMFGGLPFIYKTTEIFLMDLFITFGVIGSFLFLIFIRKIFPVIYSNRVKVMLVGIGIIIF